MSNAELVSSLVTYGLMSDENYEQLKEQFNSLFDEIKEGVGGGELLSSSIAGRSFTFASAATSINITTDDMFSAIGQALRILGGRGTRQALKRF